MLKNPTNIDIDQEDRIWVAEGVNYRGHSDRDDSLSGTIYRVAPTGFKPKIPRLNLETTGGQIAALRSPAVNVRNLGFTRLQHQGLEAVNSVAKMLKAKNPYFQARAIWLLAQLGPKGIAKIAPLLKHETPQIRVTALEGLRARALADGLFTEQRKAALTALAYLGTKEAVTAILETAVQAQGGVKAEAIWWLLNRKDSVWKAYNLDQQLKERGIYYPENIELVEIQTPVPAFTELPPIDAI